MATFSFDRPLVLTEEEATKFLEIAMKPAKPENIKPYEPNNEEDEEIIKKWYESQRNKK